MPFFDTFTSEKSGPRCLSRSGHDLKATYQRRFLCVCVCRQHGSFQRSVLNATDAVKWHGHGRNPLTQRPANHSRRYDFVMTFKLLVH